MGSRSRNEPPDDTRPRSMPASRVLGFVSVMPDAVLTVTETVGLSTCEPAAYVRSMSMSSPVRTQAGHMGAASGPGLVETAKAFAVQAQTNLDSNGVDMDRERAAFVDNSLRYEATLRFINGTVRTQLDAMKSHNAAM